MKNAAAQKLGRLGGKQTAKLGKEHMATIGRLGAKKRWEKLTSKTAELLA